MGLMYTPLTLRSHHSFARNPGMSLIFPPTFISIFSLVAHISLRSSLGVCSNFLRTTPKPTLTHRTPERTAISLLCPPGMSDFLYLSPSHAVSPTHFPRSLFMWARDCGVSPFLSQCNSIFFSSSLKCLVVKNIFE